MSSPHDSISDKEFFSRLEVTFSMVSSAPVRSMKQSIDSHSDRAKRKKTKGKITQNVAIPMTTGVLGTPNPNCNTTYEIVDVRVVRP